MFSAQVLEYFKNVRNCGELPDASTVAKVENPACGDMLELSLKVEEKMISAARFRAKGCVPTIACASRLTEMIQGQKLTTALAIQPDSLIQSLGGLPPESHHAAQLSLDALHSALQKIS